MYLAAVLPAAIKMFLLGGSPDPGCDLPSRPIHTNRLPRRVVKKSWCGARQLESAGRGELEERLGRINHKSFIKQVRGNPATRYVIYGALMPVFLLPLKPANTGTTPSVRSVSMFCSVSV